MPLSRLCAHFRRLFLSFGLWSLAATASEELCPLFLAVEPGERFARATETLLKPKSPASQIDAAWADLLSIPDASKIDQRDFFQDAVLDFIVDRYPLLPKRLWPKARAEILRFRRPDDLKTLRLTLQSCARQPLYCGEDFYAESSALLTSWGLKESWTEISNSQQETEGPVALWQDLKSLVSKNLVAAAVQKISVDESSDSSATSFPVEIKVEKVKLNPLDRARIQREVAESLRNELGKDWYRPVTFFPGRFEEKIRRATHLIVRRRKLVDEDPIPALSHEAPFYQLLYHASHWARLETKNGRLPLSYLALIHEILMGLFDERHPAPIRIEDSLNEIAYGIQVYLEAGTISQLLELGISEEVHGGLLKLFGPERYWPE